MITVTNSQPVKKTRLYFIDALRGFAALYVVLFHMVLIPNPVLLVPKWLAPWVLNGFTGVTLFFIISSFTLCLTLDGRQYQPYSIRNFYVRRIFRVVPLYYVWLFIMVLFQWGFKGLIAQKYSFVVFAFFGYNFLPNHQEGLVWASWTLGVEMVFYAIFPFIFRIVNTLQKSLIFTVISLVLAWVHFFVVSNWAAGLIAKGYHIELSIFNQLPVFATGMVVYFIYKYMNNNSVARHIKFYLLVCGFILFISLPYVLQDNTKTFHYYIMAIVYGMLFLGLSFYPRLSITNRVSVFFGMISYSLYLNHPQLLRFLSSVYQWVYSLPGGLTSHLLVCFVITVMPLTLISYITYVIIENPSVKFASRYIKK